MTASATLDAARNALHEHFGYAAFRPGQEAAVESVLAGRDTLVVLPTGGGKSLCYQVPALMLPKLTVVISPLISLMKDQVDALESRGLPATFVNSTLTSSQVSDRLSRAMRGDVKMLYVAPERFDFGATARRGCVAAGGRRGALHQRVGARFPSELSPHRVRAREAGLAADGGAHGDGDAARAYGHRHAAQARCARDDYHGVRSKEPELPRAAHAN